MTDAENGSPVIRRTKGFLCPHCGERVSVPIRIQIEEPQKAEDEEVTQHPRYGLSPEQNALLDRAEITGVLPAFRQATTFAKEAEGAGVPANMDKYFLIFLRKAVQKRVPPWVIRHFNQLFGNRPLQFWAAESVIAVLVDGALRWFVPRDRIIPKSVQSLFTSGAAGMMNAHAVGDSEIVFQQWIKTKHGYVPEGAKLFLDELRRGSIGAFANVRGNP